MNNSRTGLQSGISFTEYERALLNELKKTDPVPKNESKRLQVLRETKLIGANDLEEVYLRFTRTISRLFKVPVVAITVIDLEHVHILGATHRDQAVRIPRKGSLCNRVLIEDSPTLNTTADAQRDVRFAYSPLARPPIVTTPTGHASALAASESTPEAHPKSIRFYANVALIVDKMRIGSLCIFDHIPRPDLVNKAERLLPDFGHIISDCMDRRHKRHLGCSAEVAELSMSVVYNLKYPILELQKSFALLGETVAFQPSKRAIRVPVQTDGNSPGRIESIQESDQENSGLSYSRVTSPKSPMSCADDPRPVAISPPSSGETSSHRSVATEGGQSQGGAVRYRKVIDFDALRAEKERLPDLLYEMYDHSVALMKLLAHSLSVAHNLQAQYHRQQDIAVSTNYTVNNAFTSIAGKRPTDEASRERIYPAGTMAARMKGIHTSYSKSSLCNNNLTYTLDPVLSTSATDPEPVKFQFSSRALSLVMYTTMYHLCKVYPDTRMDVAVKFEERDFTPLYVQLANRVSSPGGNRAFLNGGMHRLNSPTSSKSALDSGKVTRMSSFAQNGYNYFTGAMSGSSDSMSDVQKEREIMLHHSRRSSLDDTGSVNSTFTHGTPPTHAAVHGNSNNINSSAHHHISMGATLANSDKLLFPIPAPIIMPGSTYSGSGNGSHHHNHHAYFTSPRTSLRKNSNSKHAQICGDLYITFKVPIRSAKNNTFSDSNITQEDELPAETTNLATCTESVSKKEPFCIDSRVETHTFENVILRNILSTAQGGFASSTGSEYFPDPPNPVLSSLEVFENNGTRGSSTTVNTSAKFGSLPSSLKMPFGIGEAIQEMREDSSSEGSYYILTVRVPCNAYTRPVDSAAMAHPAHYDNNPLAGKNMTTNTASSSTESTSQQLQLMRKHLTPIHSLRNFSSASTIMNSGSSGNSTKQALLFLETGMSTASLDLDHSNSPVPPASGGSGGGLSTKYATVKFKPSTYNVFSPRPVEDEDETAELPLRNKNGGSSKNVSSPRATVAASTGKHRNKPANNAISRNSGSIGGGMGMGGLNAVRNVSSAIVQGVSRIFGSRGAVSNKRSSDIRVTPSPHS